MLRLCYGVDWRANQDWLLSQVCQNPKREILVTPDQFSHEMERRLCAVGGDTICRCAEVLTFSRLADRVFSEYGGVADVVMDSGGRLVAIASAIEQVRARLKLYGNCAEKPEFLLQLLQTLDECKAFCVTPQALRKAAGRAEGVLAVKLEELALLAESYDAVCANGQQDAGSRLMKLDECLQACDWAVGKRFYLEGFSDFNGLELQIITRLFEAQAPVTVVLLCDGPGEGQNVFDCARDTGRALCRIARRMEIPVEIQTVAPGDSAPGLGHLREFLFESRTPSWQEDPCAVRLFTARDVHGEAMAAAGEILRQVQQGKRYRDIAVACGDLEVYRPILRAVFARYDVPAYFSGSESLLHKPMIQTVLFALRAATDGMEQESVFAYLKSGLPPLERDRCDRLENYAITWSVSGSGWQKPWDMHPAGYGAAMDDTVRHTLEQLNQDRDRAIAPLLALKKGVQEAANTAGQVMALYDFLERIEYARRMNEIANDLAAQGALQQAQEYAQLYQILTGALEQLYAVLGQSVRSGDGFYRLLRAMLSQYDVGTIPATLDCVSVGSYMSMRQKRTDVMIVLGACDGSFPASVAETGLLSQTDRQRLRELGVDVAPGVPEKLERELLGIYNVLTAPREALYLSAVAGEEAYLFRRLGRLFPNAAIAEETGIPKLAGFHREAALEYLVQLRHDPSAAQLSDCLRQALPDGGAELERRYRQADYLPGGLDRQTVERLYGKTFYLSASRIDRLAQCRCAYFFQYGLLAKERKRASFDAPVYGTFVHYVLEQTARKAAQMGGFQRLGLERVLSLAREAIDAFAEERIPDLREKPARFVYLYERNLQEILQIVQDLYEELQDSRFVPEGFELEFSKTGQMPAVRIVGKLASGELSGYVDRVDLFRNGQATYVRVVDYKTGRKDFDYTDILNGLGLQMLLYLFALEQGGEQAFGVKLQPGGVLYFPARQTVLSEAGRISPEKAKELHQRERRRKGLLLDDEIVLQAMEPGDRPAYLPYTNAKDGTRKGDLATRGQLEELKRFVFQTLADMTDSIAGGDLTPEPYFRGSAHNACLYCPYGPACHVDTGCVRQKVRAKRTREEFWAEVEEKVHG